jgi:hypothetical protein
MSDLESNLEYSDHYDDHSIYYDDINNITQYLGSSNDDD